MDKKITIGGIIVGILIFIFIIFGCLPTRYDCTKEIYNCKELDQEKAQEILDYCTQSTGLDIHELDSDHNGVACD